MLRKIVTLSGIGLTTWSPALAQAATEPASGTSEQFNRYILVVVFGLIIFFLLLIILILLQLTYLWMPRPAAAQVGATASLWERMAGLKPIEQEKSLILDEDFDGISELNNPVPGWFNALFYGTVAAGIVYLLVFHVWKVNDLQDAEYQQQLQVAEAQKEIYLKTTASSIDENSVKLVTAPNELTKGKDIFVANCASCHGQAGEGLVGPNLTDEYWIHGGTVKDVFKTIKYGVLEKGMIAWDKKLNPLQMQQVVGYIFSLKDTHPANAKEPQGDKLTADKISLK